MTTRNRATTELVARVFQVAECDARIEAARRNVDAREVAIEQWWLWFRAGKFSQARQWWIENVQGAK